MQFQFKYMLLHRTLNRTLPFQSTSTLFHARSITTIISPTTKRKKSFERSSLLKSKQIEQQKRKDLSRKAKKTAKKDKPTPKEEEQYTNTTDNTENTENNENNQQQNTSETQKPRKKNHIILCSNKLEASLVGELEFRGEKWKSVREIGPASVLCHATFDREVEEPLAFCKQIIPNKYSLDDEIKSIEKIGTEIGNYVIKSFVEEKEKNVQNKTKNEKMSWRLHLFNPSSPIHSSTHGRGTLFKEVGKYIAKNKSSIPRMRDVPQISTMENFFEIAKNNKASLWEYEPNEGLMQVFFSQKNKIYFSFCPPALRKKLRYLISPFSAGIVHIPHLPIQENTLDLNCSFPPSSAYAKLAEAQVRMGRFIQAGDVCVDFGACPGGWSWLALKQGATVVAVDWTPLASNLMQHTSLKFHKGDATEFEVEKIFTLVDVAKKENFVVDWILSDIAALPNKTVLLIEKWVKTKKCRNFCFTLKFVGSESYGILGRVKNLMNEIQCKYYLHHLNSNGNEITLFGFLE